ncbi:unnamed protein product [Pleuronectes platessa]|uniref:Uncharacterized protein n=1 Tax=Pleuronectes platessa TaxID=8262 RepID=A0A9N7V553_PLEPL|nr:unnamed protein product [Pleuronectes platessa]
MDPLDTPTGTDDQTENGRTVEDSRSPQRPGVPCSDFQAVLLAIVDQRCEAGSTQRKHIRHSCKIKHLHCAVFVHVDVIAHLNADRLHMPAQANILADWRQGRLRDVSSFGRGSLPSTLCSWCDITGRVGQTGVCWDSRAQTNHERTEAEKGKDDKTARNAVERGKRSDQELKNEKRGGKIDDRRGERERGLLTISYMPTAPFSIQKQSARVQLQSSSSPSSASSHACLHALRPTFYWRLYGVPRGQRDRGGGASHAGQAKPSQAMSTYLPMNSYSQTFPSRGET